MHVDVKLAEARDLDAVVGLANWAAEHTPANFATEPESVEMWRASWEATRMTHPWLVAHDGERVVGFAKASPHRARGAYAWTAEVSVYVHPSVQGRGVGRALYRSLIPLLRAQGYVVLLAGITAGNPASDRLHAAFGFVRCGVLHSVGWKFGRWHDVAYWELHLEPPHAQPRPVESVATVWAGLTGRESC